ncbi:tetratricopeptide repeat protein [Chitinimonas naiadis]
MIFRFLLLLCLAAFASAADIDGLWDYDRPVESEAKFREAYRKAEREQDVAAQAELLTQIARAQGMQGKIEEANKALDALSTSLGELPPLVSVRYLLERGRLLIAAGEQKKAWRWFRNAMLLAQRNNLDFHAIDAMHMLGIVEPGKTAIDWNLKAIAVAERSSQPHAADWLGSLYNNLAWVYHDQKDMTKALEYLRRAQTWHEQHGGGRRLLIARWSVAKLLRETGDPERALTIQLDLERAWNKLGEEDGYVYEEIAENLFALGRNDVARSYFRRALVTLSRDGWLVKTEPARIARLRQLAQ